METYGYTRTHKHAHIDIRIHVSMLSIKNHITLRLNDMYMNMNAARGDILHKIVGQQRSNNESRTSKKKKIKRCQIDMYIVWIESYCENIGSV